MVENINQAVLNVRMEKIVFVFGLIKEYLEGIGVEYVIAKESDLLYNWNNT